MSFPWRRRRGGGQVDLVGATRAPRRHRVPVAVLRRLGASGVNRDVRGLRARACPPPSASAARDLGA